MTDERRTYPLMACMAAGGVLVATLLALNRWEIDLRQPLVTAIAAFLVLGAAASPLSALGRAALGGMAAAVAVHLGADLAEIARGNIASPPGFDISVFWIEAKVAAAGSNFYDPSFAHEIGRQIGLDEGVIQELFFWYPPPTMLLFLPLGWMDIHAAAATIYVVTAAALVADGALIWRLFLRTGGLPALAASYALLLLIHPALTTISYGQSNFILLLGLLLFWQQRRTAAAGAWYVLANLVKPALFLLGLFVVARSGWRSIGAAVGIGSLLLAVATVVFGLGTTTAYLTENPTQLAPDFLFFQDVNQSLLAVVLRATGDAFSFGAVNYLYLGVALVIVAATAYLIFHRAVHDDVAIALGVTASLMVYPGTLEHYALVLLPAALVPWARSEARGRGQMLAAAFVALGVYLLGLADGLQGFAAMTAVYGGLAAMAVRSILAAPAIVTQTRHGSRLPGITSARDLIDSVRGVGRVTASATVECAACGYAQPLSTARYCRRCGSVRTQATRVRPGEGVAPVVAPSADFMLPLPSSRPPGRAREGAPFAAGGSGQAPRPYTHGHRSKLREIPPELSAQSTVTHNQIAVFRVTVVGLFLGLIINATATAIAIIAVITALYLGALLFRARIFWRALGSPSVIQVTDEKAQSLWEHALPIYTVLVPAFGEPEVIGHLIEAIERIDYPRERLDVKLLLEEDDVATINAAIAARPAHIEIVRVPYSEPRTKPKACNYGLRQARGKFLTIYDVEDRPEPLQLRRAVAAFRTLDESYACLQAKLAYHNPGQNSITRWFTTEYAMWFNQLLPGLVQDSAPLPLGGTSNHFRRSVLDALGGWDPYNVTEDADLGIRLHRRGYRTGVLDSTTYEEANSDFVNWLKQRSRWYKGYMQTWLVHMRNPRQLFRELGLGGFVGFNLFVGGTPLLALLNPIFWVLTLAWFVGRLQLIQDLFPWWLYYIGLVCLIGGNLLFVYTNMIAARQHGKPELVVAAAISPLYWIMMSIGAVKALVQLIHAPSYWEKTVHGLDRKEATVEQPATEADRALA